MKELCVNDQPDLRKVAQAMLNGQLHMTNWINDRRPHENELMSRWELKMITRHHLAYQVLISQDKFQATENLGRRLFSLQQGLPDRGHKIVPLLVWSKLENT